MNVTKKVLCTLEKVYATCIGEHEGKSVYIGCTEGEGGAKAFLNGKEYTIWDGPGGTMNMIPVPKKKDTYIATQRFFPVFQAENCALNLVRFENGKWNAEEIAKVPYLHRFDLYERGGRIYFIGGTLCESKESQQDWSKPGSVWTGLFSEDLKSIVQVRELKKGITKNHGMWHESENGRDDFYLTGVEGAFRFTVPGNPMSEDWKETCVIETEVSDVALCDIDGDGKKEIAAIEPFHGNQFVIYKNGKKIFKYETALGHALWGGMLAGKPAFLLGWRREEMKLIAIRCEKKKFTVDTIDESFGPSQVSVEEKDGVSYVLTANRQSNELAIYEIK